MQNEVLGARGFFGSYGKSGPTEASKCNFRVQKCSLEAQNGHAGTQIHFNTTKCVLTTPTTPNVALGASLSTISSFMVQLGDWVEWLLILGWVNANLLYQRARMLGLLL